MKTPAARTATFLMLAPAVAVGSWWLAAASDNALATDAAVEMLQALWIVRLSWLILFAPRLGAQLGGTAAIAAIVSGIVLAWPLVALGWSATALPLHLVISAEAVLLAVAVALPPLGAAMARTAPIAAFASAASSLGWILLLAAVWAARERWLPWLS